MFGVLDKLVASKPSANGLAIIIANEKSCRPDHETLSGTIHDLHAAKDAFEVLKFATLPIRNASKQQIIDIVQSTSCYEYPKCYKRLAFVFSGHGDAGCIFAHDSEVLLQPFIFDPWMPKRAKHLADIPKLFFFDSCRGDAVDRGVSTSNDPVPKGGRIPSVGNYLLAYSTMPTMKAFEQSKSGGYWMQHLAKELRDDDNVDYSLIEILQKVNRDVLFVMERDKCENIQQPVLESTLCQNIYLLKEAKCAGLEVNLNFPPHTPPQEIIVGEGSHPPFITAAYSEFIQPCKDFGPRMSLSNIAHGNSSFHNHPKQGGHDGITQSQRQSLSGDMSMSTAYIVTEPQVRRIHKEQSSMEVEGYYRGVLNNLSQTKKINIINYFDEPSKHDGKRMLYRSHVSITFLSTGQAVTGSSNWVESKSKAREQAAEDAYKQIRSIEHVSLRQPEGRGCSTTSIPYSSNCRQTSKVWKSKLKEHFDKKYKDAKIEIKYTTKECPRGGFMCTVYCPDIGYAEGSGPNKSAAEHSAAYSALNKLGNL